MKTNFEAVRTTRTYRGNCPECGKPRNRSRQFEHTVNPFNRNADGTVKDRQQVHADVHAEADAWVPDFTCQTHGSTA